MRRFANSRRNGTTLLALTPVAIFRGGCQTDVQTGAGVCVLASVRETFAMCVRQLGSLSVALPLLCAAGCAGNPLLVQQPPTTALTQQQMAMAQQVEELSGRAQTLDQDNQQLSTLLAQSRQQNRLLEEQLAATRDQLGSAAEQLVRLQTEQQSLARKTEALTASTRRRAGASISANNSFHDSLPVFSIPGVQVRRDNDVIRIEIPADKLFDNGAPQLRPGAGRMIEDVSDDLARNYPGHFIGVEGHAASDPSGRAASSASHLLSVHRASAVFDHISGRGQIPSAQLFVAGHGANHPVVSNATPQGRQRNERIELVIYPDQAK
jgi:flagellar motor protein MotB